MTSGQPKKFVWFYWLLKFLLIGPLMKILNRPVVEGLENLPKEGPVILASNHLSFSDWLFQPLLMPRRITYVAKAEYFTGRGIKGIWNRFFYTQTGNVPIDRGGGDAAQNALDTLKRLLSEGRVVAIYPEGTRSPDGRLYKGKTGVARLALESGAPVIPLGLIGTNKVCPPDHLKWKAAKVVLRIGEPMDFSRYEGMSGNRFIERAVTDEVMYQLMNLTGQEYVDVYAKRKSKSTASDAQRVPDTQAS